MGSKGGGGTNTVTNTKPPAEVLANYREVTDQAKEVAKAPYTPYSGQLVAGLSPYQQQGMQGISAAQGTYEPYAQSAQNYISQGTQGISPTEFNNANVQQYMSPYTQNVIDATMANANIEDAKQQSSLQGNAIAKGAWGGNRADLARNDLARNQALARNQTIAGLENQNYSQALGQFNTQQQAGLAAQQQNAANNLQGAGLTGALGNYAYQNQLGGAGALINAGGIDQQTNQNDLNAQYQQFQQAQAYPFNTVSWLSGITSGLGSGMGGTSSTQGPAPNAGSGILGGALGGAGLANMLGFGSMGTGIGAGAGALLGLLSDERVKEDVNKVGTLDNGLPVYTFKYKGDATTHMGVMAQEAEKKHPDAVNEVNGLKMVDYSQVAKKADGGSVMDYERSWVPEMAITPGRGLPEAPPPSMEDSNPMSGVAGAGLSALMGGGGNNPMGGIGEKLAYGMNDAGMGNQAYENLMRLDAMGGMASGGIADLNDSLSNVSDEDRYVPGFGESITNPMAVQTKLMERGYADGGMTPIPQDPMKEFFAAKNNFMTQNPDLVSMSNQNPADIAGADPNNSFASMISQVPSAGSMDNPSAAPLMAKSSLLPPGLTQGPDSSPSYISPPALDGLQEQLAKNAPTLNPAMAALAAGATMMGGESPYFGVNVGKGVSAGLKNYTDQQEAIRDYAIKQAAAQKQAEQLTMETARYNKMLDIAQQNANSTARNAETKASAEGLNGMFADPNDQSNLDVTGPELLNRLTPQGKAEIQGLLEGNKNLKNLPIKKRAQLSAMASMVDSDFDESNYDVQLKARKAYTPDGIAGKAITANNTLIHHADRAISQAKDLANQGLWTPGNNLLNVLQSNTGDPRVKVLRQTLETIASENAKALNPSGVVTDTAREEGVKNLAASIDTPEQIEAVSKNIITLAGDRMGTLRNQYLGDVGNSDYNKSKAEGFIQPESREIMKKMGIGPGAGRVKVKSPDGKTTGTVSAEKLEEYIKKGFTKIGE